MRDRAMLLVGFAGGLRRSKIVGLDVGRDQTEDGRGWIEILPLGGEPGPKLRTESCGAAIAVSFAGNISSSRAAINIAAAGMPSCGGALPSCGAISGMRPRPCSGSDCRSKFATRGRWRAFADPEDCRQSATAI
jgi:hypothetical protein